MRTLKDFLQDQADAAERTKDERLRTIEEWKGAIDRLIDQVRGWIEDSDQNHILEIDYEGYRLREEKLGSYDVHGLIIRLNSREVKLVPISRYNVGPFLRNGEIRVDRSLGRMDLMEGGRKFRLYRDRLDPTDHWIIISDEAFVPRNLDRQAFESAFLDLLQ